MRAIWLIFIGLARCRGGAPAAGCPARPGASTGAPPRPQADSVVAFAVRQLGTPYVFAGTSPDGFDCSGFVVSAAGPRPVRSVHASSAKRGSGVKISAIEGSGHKTRFLQVRRVL